MNSRAKSTLVLLYAAAVWTSCSSTKPIVGLPPTPVTQADSPELSHVRRLLDTGISLQAKGNYANSQVVLTTALSELSMLDSTARAETVSGLTQQILGAMKNNLPYSLEPESIEEPDAYEEDGLALMDSLAPDSAAATPMDSATEARLYRELQSDSGVTYDLPVEINDMVLLHVRNFKERMPQHFARWIERKGCWEDYITKELAAHGLPKDLLYLAMIESGFNPRATSPAAAAGIWQFIPSTGRRFGLRIDRFVDERRDPWKSTQAAIQYLSTLYQMFGDWRLAMASYNCGEACVGRSIRRSGTSDFWRISLPRETRNYVPKVFAAAILGKNPKLHGFNVQPWNPILADTFSVEGGLSFDQIGRALGLPADSVAVLNPALTRGTTPPLKDTWLLHLPMGTREKFALAAADLERSYQAPQPQKFTYKVRRKESLASIASRYGVSVGDLKRWNRISGKKVRAGRRLTIWGDNPGSGVAVREPPLRSRGDGIPERTAWHLKSHKVRRGETLAAIGRKYGVTSSQLMDWNGLSSGKLKPGKRVFVSDPGEGMGDTALLSGIARTPNVGTSVAANPPKATTESVEAPQSHRVRRGETLASIADRFDLNVSQLRSWNHLSSNRVRPGVRLKLHGDAEVVAAAKPSQKERNLVSSKAPRVVLVSDNASVNPVSNTHLVRPGETLESIAHQYGVAVASIKLLNRLHTSRIRIGQKLAVPKPNAARTPARANANRTRTMRYTVREGDSLFSIAKSRSTTVDSLMEINGLRASGIHPGQIIVVPTVASR